jgi:hypothetical protein
MRTAVSVPVLGRPGNLWGRTRPPSRPEHRAQRPPRALDELHHLGSGDPDRGRRRGSGPTDPRTDGQRCSHVDRGIPALPDAVAALSPRAERPPGGTARRPHGRDYRRSRRVQLLPPALLSYPGGRARLPSRTSSTVPGVSRFRATGSLVLVSHSDIGKGRAAVETRSMEAINTL